MSKQTREVALDTETTGLNFVGGDRVIEIGCVELINHLPTGKIYQTYINPESKKVEEGAFRTHKIDNNFLKNQPLFRDKVEEFLEFLSEDALVIHNAQFDLGFINNEMKLWGKLPLKHPIVDTLSLARTTIGTGPVNLDALCKKFNISIAERKIHGALLDSTLLADVYIELLGGRQRNLNFLNNKETGNIKKTPANRMSKKSKTSAPTKEEIDAHKSFVKTIKSALWGEHSY